MIAFITVYFVLHLPKRDDSHWREKLARVDFLGAFFLVSAVLCLLLGLDNGSNEGWSKKQTILPLAISPALFAAFVAVEIRVASHPFAPGHIIFERSLFAAYLCNFFGVLGQMPVLFFLPLLYQAVDGVSAVQAGLLLMPGSIFGVGASLGSGFVMRRTGRFFWMNVAGWGLLLLSFVPMVLFSGPWLKSEAGTSIALGILALGAGTGKYSPKLPRLLCYQSLHAHFWPQICVYAFSLTNQISHCRHHHKPGGTHLQRRQGGRSGRHRLQLPLPVPRVRHRRQRRLGDPAAGPSVPTRSAARERPGRPRDRGPRPREPRLHLPAAAGHGRDRPPLLSDSHRGRLWVPGPAVGSGFCVFLLYQGEEIGVVGKSQGCE